MIAMLHKERTGHPVPRPAGEPRESGIYMICAMKAKSALESS